MDNVSTVFTPKHKKVPIVISVPHCGTEFPDDLADLFRPEIMSHPPDTDWFVDQLYDFAQELGITLLRANYSRCVIDLNRSLNDEGLYSDGRKETKLISRETFSGAPIYKPGQLVIADDRSRSQKYYLPYYNDLSTIRDEFIKEFGIAMVFDAHSIARFIPQISDKPFPDLILGDRSESSSAKSFSQIALKSLKSSKYNAAYNSPFKGGNITKTFGRPNEHCHALQLEMSQDIYLSENRQSVDPIKKQDLQVVLQAMFEELAEALKKNL